MKVGICTSVSNASCIAEAGFDYLEENVQTFLLPEGEEALFEENCRKARKLPLPIERANCFLPGALKCVGPSVDRGRILRYAATAFRRARQVGISIVVFGSGGSRKLPQGFPASRALGQFVGLLKLLAAEAEKNHITIVLEPLNRSECNFINSLEQAAEVVRECAHPRVQLLVDIYHMLRENQGPEDIMRFGNLIRHAHVAEGAARTAPGIMGDNFRPYLRALHKVGYDAGISLECRWADIGIEARKGADALRRQLAAVGY